MKLITELSLMAGAGAGWLGCWIPVVELINEIKINLRQLMFDWINELNRKFKQPINPAAPASNKLIPFRPLNQSNSIKQIHFQKLIWFDFQELIDLIEAELESDCRRKSTTNAAIQSVSIPFQFSICFQLIQSNWWRHQSWFH